MTRLIINGANGRLGARINAIANEDSAFQVVATLGREGIITGKSALESHAFDVIIDVSSDDGAQRALQLAEKAQTPLFIATTGLSARTLQRINEAKNKRAVLVAPNTSVGIAVMKSICARVAKTLGSECEIGIVEYHHSKKIDAPSGTALDICERIEAEIGPKKKLKKNCVSMRIGEIIGEHTVRFASAGEEIEITHRANTRDLFAHGALKGATWLATQPPGLYTMNHALGIEE